MSTLNDLLRRLDGLDVDLAEGLRAEVKALNSRRAFGLNFERHQPEAVELPGRPVRTGDKVRVLPPRGATAKGDQTLCRVTRIETIDGARVAHLALADDKGTLPADTAPMMVLVPFSWCGAGTTINTNLLRRYVSLLRDCASFPLWRPKTPP